MSRKVISKKEITKRCTAMLFLPTSSRLVFRVRLAREIANKRGVKYEIFEPNEQLQV